MRQDSGIPDEAGAFKPPKVPALAVVYFAILIEGEVQYFHAVGGFDELHDLVAVLLAIR